MLFSHCVINCLGCNNYFFLPLTRLSIPIDLPCNNQEMHSAYKRCIREIQWNICLRYKITSSKPSATNSIVLNLLDLSAEYSLIGYVVTMGLLKLQSNGWSPQLQKPARAYWKFSIRTKISIMWCTKKIDSRSYTIRHVHCTNVEIWHIISYIRIVHGLDTDPPLCIFGDIHFG